jgi:hypothetical protein
MMTGGSGPLSSPRLLLPGGVEVNGGAGKVDGG